MRKIVYIIGVIFLLFGGHYIFKTAKVKNVFDEMYYAQVQPVPKLYTSTSFENLVTGNILENLPVQVKKDLPNRIRESYKSDKIGTNEGLRINFYETEKKLEIIGVKRYGNESLRFTYVYNMDTEKIILEEVEIVQYNNTDYDSNDLKTIKKLMKKYQVTGEDLSSYQYYFLYEKVLSDWFAHNPKSRFSLDDLGNVEIVEADAYEE